MSVVHTLSLGLFRLQASSAQRESQDMLELTFGLKDLFIYLIFWLCWKNHMHLAIGWSPSAQTLMIIILYKTQWRRQRL